MTPEFRQAHLIVIAYFPKTRDIGGLVEAHDVWSFAVAETL